MKTLLSFHGERPRVYRKDDHIWFCLGSETPGEGLEVVAHLGSGSLAGTGQVREFAQQLLVAADAADADRALTLGARS